MSEKNMELYQTSIPTEQLQRETQAERDLKRWESLRQKEVLAVSKDEEAKISADILDTNLKYFEQVLPEKELGAYRNEIAFVESQKEYETEMTLLDTQQYLEKHHFAVEMGQTMSA